MDGVLIIDKPEGFTSHDVVAHVRRIVHERRVGHTGTLDPFASGVLVVLVGRATRLAQFLSGADKEYEALIRLGFATDTGDRMGTPLPPRESSASLTWNDEDIETALSKLRGEIEQVPPMYSAKKQQGRKLYELARRGEQVPRQPVRVNIRSFTAIAPPLLNPVGTTDLRVRVVCSAGTYVRTLAEDFGKELGVPAHLAELRRTMVGNFSLAHAVTLNKLKEQAQQGLLSSVLLSPDEALRDMPFISLNPLEVKKTQQGLALNVVLSPNDLQTGQEHFRMRDEKGNLIAVGIYERDERLIRPRVVLSTE